jgi:UDP-N-acetylglucosamine 2-epimerase (non-hydrolysing)
LIPRVLVVVGTRPEAIKMAPVVRALRGHSDRLETRLALTGQHTTLVEQVLDAFGLHLAYDLQADYDLAVMTPGQSLFEVVERSLVGLRTVIDDFRPDVVLAEGDTATVFVAALAAFFRRVKVGHVEAGLRSHDKHAPFPEEIFRRLTDTIADYRFAPTPGAAANLLAEGVSPETVHVTGNTVVDALLVAAGLERPVSDEALASAIAEPDARLVLLTAHRRESFGEPIREAFRAVREVADRFEDVRVVYPVHPNPEVREPARELLADHARIALTEPLDYLDTVAAMRHASLILTDSGGIQEEAPTFGTPVLVLREVTERPEGVEAGAAELVGTDHERIVERAAALLADRTDRTRSDNPYGDGRAGERIADILVADLTGAPRLTEDWRP